MKYIILIVLIPFIAFARGGGGGGGHSSSSHSSSHSSSSSRSSSYSAGSTSKSSSSSSSSSRSSGYGKSSSSESSSTRSAGYGKSNYVGPTYSKGTTSFTQPISTRTVVVYHPMHYESGWTFWHYYFLYQMLRPHYYHSNTYIDNNGPVQCVKDADCMVNEKCDQWSKPSFCMRR